MQINSHHVPSFLFCFLLLFLSVPPSPKGGDSAGIQLRDLPSRLKSQLCWIWGRCLLPSLNLLGFIKPWIKHSGAHSPCNVSAPAKPPHCSGRAMATKPALWKQFLYLVGFSSLPVHQQVLLSPFSLPVMVPGSFLQAPALRDVLK